MSGSWLSYGPFPTYASEGWLLDEDRAVRDLMKNMCVSDHENPKRRVEAWFGHPDQELREQKYPYITVDLLQIQEGIDRVHRGYYWFNDPVWWWKMPPLPSENHYYLTEMPTPIDLDYQISTWARNPRHDRQILQQLITGGRTQVRGGLLHTADKRIRRLDYLGHVKRDLVESGKRLHTNHFRIRVSSQVPYHPILPQRVNLCPPEASGNNYGIVGPVTSVHLDMYTYAQQLAEESKQHDGKIEIVVAEVFAWNNLERTVDLRLFGRDPVIIDVPATREIDTLEPGDAVSVLRQPLVQIPTVPSDYRHIVIGLETTPVAWPVPSA